MLDKINLNVLSKLQSEMQEVTKAIQPLVQQQESIREEIKKEISNILPKGYWYSCEIDPNWHRPKKYSIKEIDVYNNGSVDVTIKEVFKKQPWPGFTGRRDYSLNNFLKFKIYKTAEEATDAYYHRICPKCGGFMMYSDYEWCNKCMNIRAEVSESFQKDHTFYCPADNRVYAVEYEDELTRRRGFEGKHFTLKRLDTGEIIHTSNLWSRGYGERYMDSDKLPQIEFINND